MTAYVVALIETISDPATYGRYVEQVEATLTPFGGRFLARKAGPEVLEGSTAPARGVLLGFPTEDAARKWHASAPYQPVMQLRQSASRALLLLLPAYNANAPRPSVGDVCYVEIVTPDVEAVVRVQEASFGHTFSAPDEHLGSARIAMLSNGARFAIRAPMHDSEGPLTRAYVRVEDLEKAVAQAEKSGAHIALPSMTLGPYGSIAIWIVGGVEQGAWQLP